MIKKAGFVSLEGGMQACKWSYNIGALLIRILFGVYYTITIIKSPQNSIIKAPILHARVQSTKPSLLKQACGLSCHEHNLAEQIRKAEALGLERWDLLASHDRILNPKRIHLLKTLLCGEPFLQTLSPKLESLTKNPKPQPLDHESLSFRNLFTEDGYRVDTEL